MHFSKATFLRKGRIVEVARVDAEICGNMISDHFEPSALLGSELVTRSFLLSQPDLKFAFTRSGNGTSSLSWWMAKRTRETRSVRIRFAVVPLTLDLSRAA